MPVAAAAGVPFAYQTASCDTEMTITGRSSGRSRDASLPKLSHMANRAEFFDHSDLGPRATVRGMRNSIFMRAEEHGLLGDLDPSVATRKEM
jgi:hypothetical protein